MLSRCSSFVNLWFPRIYKEPPVPGQVLSLADPEVERTISLSPLSLHVVHETVRSIGRSPSIETLESTPEGYSVYRVGSVQVIDKSAAERIANNKLLGVERAKYELLTQKYFRRKYCAIAIEAAAISGMVTGMLPQIYALMNIYSALDPTIFTAVGVVSTIGFVAGEYLRRYNNWAFGKAPEYFKTLSKSLETWQKHPAAETVKQRTLGTPHSILGVLNADPVKNKWFHERELNALFFHLIKKIKESVEIAKSSLEDKTPSQRFKWTAEFYRKNKISERGIDCLTHCLKEFRPEAINPLQEYIKDFSELHNRLQTHQDAVEDRLNKIRQEERNACNEAELQRSLELASLKKLRDAAYSTAWRIKEMYINQLPSFDPQSDKEIDVYNKSVRVSNAAYRAACSAADALYESQAGPIKSRYAAIISKIHSDAHARIDLAREESYKKFQNARIMDATINSFCKFYDGLFPQEREPSKDLVLYRSA